MRAFTNIPKQVEETMERFNTAPSRRTLVTGFSTGFRVSSLMMGKILTRGCPAASAGPHPVKA